MVKYQYYYYSYNANYITLHYEAETTFIKPFFFTTFKNISIMELVCITLQSHIQEADGSYNNFLSICLPFLHFHSFSLSNKCSIQEHILLILNCVYKCIIKWSV